MSFICLFSTIFPTTVKFNNESIHSALYLKKSSGIFVRERNTARQDVRERNHEMNIYFGSSIFWCCIKSTCRKED